MSAGCLVYVNSMRLTSCVFLQSGHLHQKWESLQEQPAEHFPWTQLQQHLEGETRQETDVWQEHCVCQKEFGRESTTSSCRSLTAFLCLYLQYLSYCMDLCPRAYSDNELLLLLTVVGRLGLDTRLILQSSVELYPLQSKLVRNIRDWENMVSSYVLLIVWFLTVAS